MGKHIARFVGALSLAAVMLYVATAYFVLPRFWTRYDERSVGLLRPMVTATVDGRPGDPINIGLEASRGELDRAMRLAGWSPADPITLWSSLRIAASVVLDRPYPDAPVSPLLYEGRIETAAYEKPVGRSADRRQHVRLWLQPTFPGSMPSSWLGSVTFDAGVGLSHYTGAVTHDIAPDIDSARDRLVADLQSTGQVLDVESRTGIGPIDDGRNGEGSPYRTDGLMRIVMLAQP